MTFEYKDTLQRFRNVMADKLEENQHKEHWSRCPIWWLQARMLEEIAELINACHTENPTFDTIKEVDREAADVAAFAMMIADNFRRDVKP